MTERCQFYLERKRRYCSSLAKPGEKFCGNHLHLALGTEERVPCPFDPSHFIPRDGLQQHRSRCPTLLQQQATKAQPYCIEDCNAGNGPPPNLSGARCQEDGAGLQIAKQRSLQRADWARSLGPAGLHRLIEKIQAAHAEACSEEDVLREIRPPESEVLLRPDHVRPFSLRHAMQQASIVGNMQQYGLLEGIEQALCIEYAAGTGYLSNMLRDCCDAREFILVDNQSFRLKAERFLRAERVVVERIKLNIKDFNPRGLRQLQATTKPWLAYGKHLCGTATDFTLRCCASAAGDSRLQQQVQLSSSAPDDAPSNSGAGEPAVAIYSSDRAAGNLKGIAVATCCHHRCAWEHYVGQQLFTELGFSPAEFELVSWMTGWALCGHEAPSGTAAPVPDGFEAASRQVAALTQGRPIEKQKKKSNKRRREAAARERVTALLKEQQAVGCPQNPSRTPGQAAGVEQQCSTNFDCQSGQQLYAIEVDGERLSEEVAENTHPDSGAAEDGSSTDDDRTKLEARVPAASVPPQLKVAVGKMCKRLIDHGRLLWLKQQGFKAEGVLYVPAAVSGENRLLLAAPATADPTVSCLAA